MTVPAPVWDGVRGGISPVSASPCAEPSKYIWTYTPAKLREMQAGDLEVGTVVR